MKTKIVCLIISLLWIGIGTLMQISGYPNYNFLGFDYSSIIYNILWWITFPSNILLFMLLYADTLENIYIPVILLQSIKVLVYWWLIYKIWLSIRKARNGHLNTPYHKTKQDS